MNKNQIIKIIDWILITTMIILIIIAWIHGAFNCTKIVETCNGYLINGGETITWNLTT